MNYSIHFPAITVAPLALIGVEAAQSWERAGFLATSLAVSAVIASLYLRTIKKNEAAKLKIEQDRENDRIAREAAYQKENLDSDNERKAVLERFIGLYDALLVQNKIISGNVNPNCKTENTSEVHDSTTPPPTV